MSKRPTVKPALLALMLAMIVQPLSVSAQNGPVGNAASQGMVLPGHEWSLPCETKLNRAGERVLSVTGGTMLKGSVTQWNIDGDFGQLIDALLDGALSSHPEVGDLNHKIAHYGTSGSRLLANAVDTANYVIEWRGSAPSSELADVILDQKIKIKDRASAEYARQRLVDELHPQVVAKTMQLAMALGTKDAVARDELLSKAMDSLETAVGKDRARLALNRMEQWTKFRVPESAYAQAANWDVESYQAKVKQITKVAMDGDPTMTGIITSLRKYNNQSALARGADKVIPATLNIASFAAPGYLIPLALMVLNGGYEMARGGPEENKLMKELYYDKRIESRYRTVSEEAQLSLSQYQNAVNARNPVLMMCCESIISQLVGAENVESVLGRTLLSHQPGTVAASSPNQAVQ